MVRRPTRAIEILAAIVGLFCALVVYLWCFWRVEMEFDIVAEEPIRSSGILFPRESSRDENATTIITYTICCTN